MKLINALTNPKPTRVTIYFYLLAILLISQEAARSQPVLSLSECAALLAKNNLQYRQGQLQTEEIRGILQQVKAQRLPQIGISSSQNVNLGRSIDRFTNSYVDQLYNSNSISIGAQAPVFQGFLIQNQVRQNQLLVEGAENNQTALLNNQTILLLQAYVSVLAGKELYGAALQQTQASVQQTERVSKQAKAGVIGENTLYEIKAQLASDRYDQVLALNRYRTAQLTLFQLLNLPPDKNIQLTALNELPDPSQTASSEGIFDQASQTFPEIRSAEARWKSHSYQIKTIKAQNWPSLSLSGSFGAFYASTNGDLDYMQQLNATRNGGISLGLNIPIMSRWATRPRISTAKVQEQIARNQLDISKQVLRQQIEQAVLDANAARDSYAMASSQAESMQAGFSVAESRLNAGTASVFEYSLAKSKLAAAQAIKIRSYYELILRGRLLLFYRQGNWDGIL